MPIDIQIDADTVKYLNEPATAEFQVAVQQFGFELLQESGRLEAARKTTKGDPEITSSMVRDADVLLRRGFVRPKKDWGTVGAQLASTFGGVAVGFYTDPAKLANANNLVVFILILVVTITATVVVLVKD